MEETVEPTGIYMREGTASRVMATDRLYDKFYDFYSVSTEYFGNRLVFVEGRQRFWQGQSCRDIKLTAYHPLGPRLSRGGAKALPPVPK
jgi:hypothetical protein